MSMHPRPNPIVAALYTLRDLDVDVVVIHGPAGCGFMASRMIEEAGVRVVTTSMGENELIFGASDRLVSTLRDAEFRFRPDTMAVIGTCASMIIGEDMGSAVRRAGLSCKAFPVDCHGCMGNNTEGAVRAINSAEAAGLLDPAEANRQRIVLRAATDMEHRCGMAGKDYLSPVSGPTKLKVARRIADTLSEGGRVAAVMLAKKELAYRFADVLAAVDEARDSLGGSTFLAANLDETVGLPRIRGYARDINRELSSRGVILDATVGGLDEYAVVGDRMTRAVEGSGADLLVLAGIPHAYPGMGPEDILVTDQPRQLANYLSMGCGYAVGEISSHSLVMNTRRIVPTETGDTLRDLLRDGF